MLKQLSSLTMRNISYFQFISVFNLLFLFSCDTSSVNEDKKNESIASYDTVPAVEKSLDKSLEIIVDTLPLISYSILQMNDSVIHQLPQQFPDSQLSIICAINRIDPDRLHRADSLMIPDSIYFDLNNYSPYPQKITIADSVDKLILISYRYQAFALYTKGKLEKWGPVSMGAKNTKTPTGLFHTNWKSKSQISTDNSSWILPWYFNLVNNTGVSLHQFELPGFPASHSCVRLRLSDAEYIYYFAEQWKLDEKGWKILVEGTPVIIFGEYPFGKQRPWFEAAISQSGELLSADTLSDVIRNHLPQIIEEQKVRKQFFRKLEKDSVI
ncbi:MAG: L,D-transpeptidase [Bacteroidia bacterium]